MIYKLNLSTQQVLRLIQLGESPDNLECLTESQKDTLRNLAAELRQRLEAL